MYVWTPDISDEAVLHFSSCKVILPPTDRRWLWVTCVCYVQADKASYQLLLSKGQFPHIKSVSNPMYNARPGLTHTQTYIWSTPRYLPEGFRVGEGGVAYESLISVENLT